MKKLLSTLLMLSLCFTLFAQTTMADEYVSGIYSVGTCFAPEHAKMLGMGSAGLALPDAENGLFYNPASLGEGKFRLSLPSVSVSAYHVYDILKEDIVNKIGGDTAELVSSVLNIVGTQYAPLAKVDVSASVIFPFGVGLGLYAGDTLSTYSGSAIDELNLSLVAGFGNKIQLGPVSVSAGITAEYNALVFNKRVKVADVMGSEDIMQTRLTLASGWTGASPVLDAGLTVNLAGFSASVVVSNILEASLDMTAREAAIEKLNLEDIKADILSENTDFSIPGHRTISAGLAGDFSLGFLGFSFAIDVNDIEQLSESLEEAELERVLTKHVKAGVELTVLNWIALRYGLNSGYQTLGASFSLTKLLRIDAAYYWKEMGSIAGSRGLDGITIRLNLGWE
jgi:hypothetical protein